jgi:hypothetical protein
VIDKLGWIKKQKLRFKQQLRQSKRSCISGECHPFLGEPYRLKVVNHDGKPQIKALKSGELRMLISADADQNAREKLLVNWYRQQLRDLIPILIAKWEPIVGVEINECRIRKMKTKWGSCNIEDSRVWLNLELVKKPQACIDCIFLHELTHLLHRRHDENFKKLLKKFMPDWQVHHKALNASALVHDKWDKT